MQIIIFLIWCSYLYKNKLKTVGGQGSQREDLKDGCIDRSIKHTMGTWIRKKIAEARGKHLE